MQYHDNLDLKHLLLTHIVFTVKYCRRLLIQLANEIKHILCEISYNKKFKL